MVTAVLLTAHQVSRRHVSENINHHSDRHRNRKAYIQGEKIKKKMVIAYRNLERPLKRWHEIAINHWWRWMWFYQPIYNQLLVIKRNSIKREKIVLYYWNFYVWRCSVARVFNYIIVARERYGKSQASALVWQHVSMEVCLFVLVYNKTIIWGCKTSHFHFNTTFPCYTAMRSTFTNSPLGEMELPTPAETFGVATGPCIGNATELVWR
jgi:hypothetical protein